MKVLNLSAARYGAEQEPAPPSEPTPDPTDPSYPPPPPPDDYQSTYQSRMAYNVAPEAQTAWTPPALPTPPQVDVVIAEPQAPQPQLPQPDVPTWPQPTPATQAPSSLPPSHVRIFGRVVPKMWLYLGGGALGFSALLLTALAAGRRRQRRANFAAH